ncbi:MAG: DUF402 domain-containing protein [Pyrinomonadaceae bacterium]|nr:DUF402 domain-containing protein [Pyrinomonadaceae bacterium]
MTKPIITINSRKFDYSIHKSWTCELISENSELLTFLGEFDREINHPQLGIIRRGTLSYEYYWKYEYFNIFRFHEPEGNLKFYYCNINLPPKFENDVLDYVDLDIDILVKKDLSYQILDIEEFEENAIRFEYSKELKTKIDKTIEQLAGMIRQRDFPFDQNF